jgi:hypothetical protein
MSRRTKKSKEELKTERTVKKDKRKNGVRKELDRVIIACEGRKTERNYFRAIFNNLIQNRNISKTSLVLARHKSTHSEGVLEDLLKELNKDADFEHQWIVIDRDEHESFSDTLDKAKSIGIEVAYSNPSFELWFLLHFDDYRTATHRHHLPDLLKKYIPYRKNSTTIYDDIFPRQKDAIERAKKLIFDFTVDGRKLNPTIDNPSTTVYKLVEVLNELGRKE